LPFLEIFFFNYENKSRCNKNQTKVLSQALSSISILSGYPTNLLQPLISQNKSQEYGRAIGEACKVNTNIVKLRELSNGYLWSQ
jgi:hypothetical protein